MPLPPDSDSIPYHLCRVDGRGPNYVDGKPVWTRYCDLSDEEVQLLADCGGLAGHVEKKRRMDLGIWTGKD